MLKRYGSRDTPRTDAMGTVVQDRRYGAMGLWGLTGGLRRSSAGSTTCSETANPVALRTPGVLWQRGRASGEANAAHLELLLAALAPRACRPVAVSVVASLVRVRRPRLHYHLRTLRPSPTDPVGQSWPRGTGSVGDSVGEGCQTPPCTGGGCWVRDQRDGDIREQRHHSPGACVSSASCTL